MAIKITIKVWEDINHEFAVLTGCGSVRFLQKKHAAYFAATRKQQFNDLLHEAIDTNALVMSKLATCNDLRTLQVVSFSQKSFFTSYDFIVHYNTRNYVYLENHLLTMLDELLYMCDVLGMKCIFNRIDRVVNDFYSLKYTNFAKSFEIIKRKKYKPVFNVLQNSTQIAV